MSLKKFNKIEIILRIFFDHNALKLEINCKRRRLRTPTNMWRLNNILLKNDQVKQEIQGEMKRYIDINENDNTAYQNFWDAAKVVMRGTFYHHRPMSRNK